MMLGRPSGRLPWTVLSRVFYGGFEMLRGSSLPLQRKTYDVVIVGSGAGGGMAAHTLTRAGANVLLLEAGGPWDNTKDSAMLRMPYTSPRRGASTPDRPFGEFDACVGGWELQGEPFTQAEGRQCNRGCRTNSNFSSTNVLIAPALKTGRLTLQTHAMAREVTVDARGLASGTTYIDTRTGAEHRANARVVVLAASACETARLLLNSKSAKFPQGLANSSGVVGKYLTDTTGTDVSGLIPKMMDHVPHNEDGVGGNHI